MLGSLQIISEVFRYGQSSLSIEHNLEIEKEEKEKEDETEFLAENLFESQYFCLTINYTHFIIPPYQDPTLSVWLTPPEATV